MHDPFLLYDMEKAVELIQQAIASNKKIAVYGDYDGDGVTSVTVITTALERMGADVCSPFRTALNMAMDRIKNLFQRIV